MACDYQAIRRDNERRYGTDIGRIGPMLLANRYDDRTHFIFELLQNAEDALAKRGKWDGHRSVRFHLGQKELRVSHFGRPFDELDVRGVCGIAESTKDLTAIGRFGIGFKSVYAFTDRPEIYSGSESFAIDSFVWPVAVPPIQCEAEETLIVLPLHDLSDRGEIETGLKRLGPGALLFLRAIEEIEWQVDGGSSGLYLRSRPQWLGESVRRITVVGQSAGNPDIEESWLLFSRPVVTPHGKDAGYAEIAFSVVKDDKLGKEQLRPVPRSPLIVFFPTVLETHLGFLVQGPYRTTPSRDNVPSQDTWNRHCIAETASVLRDALHWLRDNGLLDVGGMRCLPLERAKFPESNMFAAIFEKVRTSLSEEPLLPRHGGGHVTATNARLARTQELRDLLSSGQLKALYGPPGELAWLSGDISQDRSPELRQYLIEELKIEEVRPDTILPKLGGPFLESQTDEWVRRLYEFLADQKALLPRAKELPLVRLTNGKHVRAQLGGQPQGFMPGPTETSFPTVTPAVCDTEDARAFLKALGLTEPDVVDDVIQNILPRYRKVNAEIAEHAYTSDVERMLSAYKTDSAIRRTELITAMSMAPFVVAIEQHKGVQRMAKAGEVYFATDRLAELFTGIRNVLLVDSSFSCLKGEEVRALLEACGALRYLRPIEDSSLSSEERRKLREQSGYAETSGINDRVTDWTLFGLRAVLDALPDLSVAERQRKTGLLWEELVHLEERRGKGVFTGEYTWSHYGNRRAPAFDAAFVRLLNSAEWVPDREGNLQRPAAILFESLEWKSDPFLASKIRFKPPLVDQLAREAGIEPGVLDLLKKLGVTTEADLRARLRVEGEDESKGSVDDALKKLLGSAPPPAPPEPDPASGDPGSPGNGTGSGGNAHGNGGATGHGAGTGRTGGKRTPGSAGGRPFISYVATQPDNEEPDPDGLDQTARMALEAKAIDFILSRETGWQRTPTHNPGFDLFQPGANGQPVQWCEVKAMTASLNNRPVGLSRTQFDFARQHGQNYWLYAVENAGTENARIVRIQDPAGKARTFTFDRGWLSIAEVDTKEQENTGD